jgi:hypothetical protein
MNQSQKVSIGLLFATLVLFISMHNPMSGYIHEGNFYKVDIPLTPCADQDKKNYREFLTNHYRDDATREKQIFPNGDPNQVEKIITKQVDMCHLLAPGIPTSGATTPDFRRDQLEFSEWRSVDPSIGWLGKIVNLFSALLAVSLICASCVFFVFPTND